MLFGVGCLDCMVNKDVRIVTKTLCETDEQILCMDLGTGQNQERFLCTLGDHLYPPR